MEKFDINTLTEIKERVGYIHSVAINNYHDNPEFMDTIDLLARVGGMFADIKIQELEGHVETSDPQGYIVSKLSTSYYRMNNYERKRKMKRGK